VTAWPFTPEEMPVSAIAPGDSLGLIADQLARGQIHWKQAHDLAIAYYTSRNDQRALEREYRTLINQLPFIETAPYLRLAHLMLQQKRFGEVRPLLEQSLLLEPTLLAHRALGDIALYERRPADAVPPYQMTFNYPQSAPELAENGTLLATALFLSGDTLAATQRVNVVLATKPDYMPAIELLDRITERRR
jgi:tetratricopeptide (TPR) repeat protein